MPDIHTWPLPLFVLTQSRRFALRPPLPLNHPRHPAHPHSLAVQARPLLLHDRLLCPHGGHRLRQLSILRLQAHQRALQADPAALQLA